MGEPFSPSSNTTPKLSSALSVSAYARSSCSAGGVAWASLSDPTHPLRHMVRQEEGGQGKLAAEQMDASMGSPAWWLVA